MEFLNPTLKYMSILLLAGVALYLPTRGQTCTPQGDQKSYGINNTWIGYVYQGANYNVYKGMVTEGTASSPDFTEGFGGDKVYYNTAGCPVFTDSFSVLYKLTKTFSGSYRFTVTASNGGFRLSLDGGKTWVINRWVDQPYTSIFYEGTLNGTCNMVLEYFHRTGPPNLSFSITPSCLSTEIQGIFGTNHIWNGYIYSGYAFNYFKGRVTEGSSSSSDFDENFGSNTPYPITYYTSSCPVQTTVFSARYLLTDSFPYGAYVLTVGGDDGYRFSLDGGHTWVINQWKDQSYTTTDYVVTLKGTYNMVLEYYQNMGYKRVSFKSRSVVLPVNLVTWSAISLSETQSLLKWETTNAVDFDHFTVQRSTNGTMFDNVQDVKAVNNSSSTLQQYSFTDNFAWSGTLFYRLLMVDKNGDLHYSTVLTLLKQPKQAILIYPTRVEDGTVFIQSVEAIAHAKLELFDMNGRVLLQKDWPLLRDRQQVFLNSRGNLPAGSYCLRLSDEQKVLGKQIIIVPR